MKCRETEYWLYTFRPNAAWPVEIVSHLQGCADCQALRARLQQLDQEIIKHTSASGNALAKEQLLERIAKTPQAAGPPRVLPWGRISAYAAWAAALFLFGFVLGRSSDKAEAPAIEKIKTVEVFRDKLVEVVRDKIVQVSSPSDRSLFMALLKRNARLVQTSLPGDRLEVLLDMAEDCRQHALTLIEQGPRDTLPLAIELYTQLLRDGVLAQLAQTPLDARAALQAQARTRLIKFAEPMENAPRARIVEEQRVSLRGATLQALDLVDRPDEAPQVKPMAAPQSATPSASLVRFAIAITAEADSIAKADACSDCVKHLMPHVMLALAEDASPERVEMGQQFGEMIQFGIYTPLDVATVKEPPPPIKAQTQRIIQLTADTIAQLEKNMAQSPEALRPPLQRALEASKKGWEKHKGKGKGKQEGKEGDGQNNQKSTPKKGDAQSQGFGVLRFWASMSANRLKEKSPTCHLHLAAQRRQDLDYCGHG